MKKHVTRSKDTYEDFLRNLKLITLALTSSNCKLDLPVYFSILDKKKVAKKLKANYSVSEVEEKYFSTKAALRVTIQDETEELLGVTIECEYAVYFHCKRPVNQEFASKFADTGLRLVVWPYFREFVFDLSGKMAIPPITLPLSTEDD